MSQRSKTPPADRSQKNLHVCNLPPVASDEDVREIFAQYGEVTSAMVVRDLHTGKSTRTAFVSFARAEEAVAARAALHKRRLSGERWLRYQNKLSVQWAKKEHDAVPVGDARVEMRELFVRNVPLDVTDENLRDVVSACGNVVHVRLCEDTHVNVADPRRIAFILFEEPGAADAALHALHDRCPFPSCCGVPLMCKLKEEKSAKPFVPRTRSSGGASTVDNVERAPPYSAEESSPSFCFTAPVDEVPLGKAYDASAMFESPGLSLANMEAESQVFPTMPTVPTVPTMPTMPYMNSFITTFVPTATGDIVPVYTPICMPFPPIVLPGTAPIYNPTYTPS